MSKLRKKIVFVHLLNDYSGSPLILSQVMNAVDEQQYEKILFTSQKGKEGFLSGLSHVQEKYFWYRWMKNPWLRLFTYGLSQMILFFRLLQYWRKDVIIYVNTLLPFGAGLAGKLMGKKVIYHVHETSMKPALLKKFLRMVCSVSASKVIHVSQYMAQHETIPGAENLVIYNTLSESFMATAVQQYPLALKKEKFIVLMLCSLKEYKGVDEFVALSRRIPTLQFELVLNASEQEIVRYFSVQMKPANLSLFPAQKNVHPFYQRASLLLNLSHTDKWIETFGMTVLEGMFYHLPAIVPPVGGIAELVEDGKNGYQEDSQELLGIVQHIQLLASDPQLYHNMSVAAYEKALAFTGPAFRKDIGNLINQVGKQASTFSELPVQQYKTLSS